ncbi:MAG: glycosyltransferase family 4 protein, partial [Candidatus Eisenbacteria bacterium]
MCFIPRQRSRRPAGFFSTSPPSVWKRGFGAPSSGCGVMALPDRTEAGASPRPTVTVLRIIARLNVGGPAIHTALLTARLDDQGFRSLLVTGTPGQHEGDMSYLARQLGVEPRVIPELGRDLSWRDDLVAFGKLVRLMRELRPQIVHTHTAKAGAIGRLAALVAGVPIRVHTFHGHVFRGYFSPLKSQVFLWIERLLGR